MKNFESYLREATEAQWRAQNPYASPEKVRAAAERSQRSAAQREGNQKTKENDIKKGKRSLSGGKDEIVKATSNLAKRRGGLAKTEPKSSALATRAKKKPSYFTKPDGVNKRSADNKIMGKLTKNDVLKNEKEGRKKVGKWALNKAKSALKGTRGSSNISQSSSVSGLQSSGTQI